MLLSAVCVLWSAFLLFSVQPLVAKTLLPSFGGGPAVWATCMVFFQLVLLAGYAYAHALTRAAKVGVQQLVHGSVAALSLLWPLILSSTEKVGGGSAAPVLGILLALSLKVGAPAFVLSATSPLIQAWVARSCPTRSPY